MRNKSSINCVLVVGIALLGCVGCSHPSDTELIELLSQHKNEFERLIEMINADEFVVVSYDYITTRESHREIRAPGDVVTEERWNEYRKLFRRLSLDSGIASLRTRPGMPLVIEFRVSSRGVVFGGSGKGLVYTEGSCEPLLEMLDSIPAGVSTAYRD